MIPVTLAPTSDTGRLQNAEVIFCVAVEEFNKRIDFYDLCDQLNASFIVQFAMTQLVTSCTSEGVLDKQVVFVTEHGEQGMRTRKHCF